MPAPTWSSALSSDAIRYDTVFYQAGADRIRAWLATPRTGGPHPAVIVVHANRLSEPYIESTTAMLAEAGFAALAVDLFHYQPGNESWETARQQPGDLVRAAIEREFREPRMVSEVQAAIDYLRSRDEIAPGGIGVVGFCGGGWNALLLAAQLRDIGAVVAFYAPVDRSDFMHRSPLEVADYIRVPVQFHYATRDENVPLPPIVELGQRVTANRAPFERFDYDAEHGFFAHNRGVFDEQDATAAWHRLVPFLHEHVGRPVGQRPTAPARSAATPAGGASHHLGLH